MRETKLITCDACMGSGVLDTGCDTEGTVRCHHCGGTGTIETEVEDEVTLEAAALDEFSEYIAAIALVAKVRIEDGDTTASPDDATHIVFEKASLILAKLNALKTASQPLKSLWDVMDGLETMEHRTSTIAKCMIPTLQKDGITSIDELNEYKAVLTRSETAHKWIKTSMVKLLTIMNGYEMNMDTLHAQTKKQNASIGLNN